MGKKVIVVETLYEYIGEVEETILDEHGVPKAPFILKDCFRMHTMMDGNGAVTVLVGPYEGLRIRQFFCSRLPTKNEAGGYQAQLAKSKAGPSPIVRPGGGLPQRQPTPEEIEAALRQMRGQAGP